jgi:hypothetical protein
LENSFSNPELSVLTLLFRTSWLSDLDATLADFFFLSFNSSSPPSNSSSSEYPSNLAELKGCYYSIDTYSSLLLLSSLILSSLILSSLISLSSLPSPDMAFKDRLLGGPFGSWLFEIWSP